MLPTGRGTKAAVGDSRERRRRIGVSEHNSEIETKKLLGPMTGKAGM